MAGASTRCKAFTKLYIEWQTCLINIKYVTEVTFFNIMQQSVTFPVIYCFRINAPAFTYCSITNNVMYALKSVDPVFRTNKVVYSQIKSNLQGLLPDESAIHGSIARLNMQQEQIPVAPQASHWFPLLGESTRVNVTSVNCVTLFYSFV